MGFRVGKKIGDYYVTTGKSGTRISKKIGDFNVSYWKSNKKGKNKPSEDVSYSGDAPGFLWCILFNIAVMALVYLTFTYYSGDMLMGLLLGYGVYFFIHCFIIAFNWDDNDWDVLFLPFFAPVYTLFSGSGFLFWVVLLIIGLFL